MRSVSVPESSPGQQPATTRSTAEEHRPSWKRVIFGAGVGNALEWYDWSVYAVFAPFFAQQFFNPRDAVSATLSTLAVFAVGFVMRPLGGLFFGWFADRVGRQPGMVLSMALTAAGSLVIAVAPTYESVGVLASVLLLVARLLQGFGLGGEIGASHTYLAEAAPPARRGLWSSSMYVAVTTGVLFATVQAAVLKDVLTGDQMTGWGWRIPFVIGALLGIYAFYLRRGLQENEAFRKEKEHDEQVAHADGGKRTDAAAARPSLMSGIWENRRSVLRVVALTVGGTVLYYTWAIAAPGYAISVKGIDPSGALWASVVANLVFILALPMWGAISDRWGRRPVCIVFAIGHAVLLYPLQQMIQDSAWQLGLAMSIALFIMAASTSVLPALFAEMFPTRVRASGMAVPYSLAVAATGGTAPYLQTYLAGKDLSIVFIGYTIVLITIGLVAVLRMPETKGKDLE